MATDEAFGDRLAAAELDFIADRSSRGRIGVALATATFSFKAAKQSTRSTSGDFALHR